MASARSTERHQRSPLSGESELIAAQKRAAADAAAELVEDGIRLGLGTGSTVAHLLKALEGRELGRVQCVATSPATEWAARAMGLTVRELDDLGELDLAIDGADQVDPDGWLVKGGGAAHTREKIVAAAARRFVAIVSDDKLVRSLHAPIPLELVPFAVQTTLAKLAPARLRDVPRSPDGGLIADYLGDVDDPRQLAQHLSATPGVVEHGLFEPELVSSIVIAGESGVRRRDGAKR